MQGAYERPLDNTIINKYVITKIEPVAKNPSVIEVAYKYTSNGVVEVSAVQKETGKTLPIRIEKIPDDMSWTDGSPKDQASPIPDVKIILAVDLSGSMSGDPLQKAKDAMHDFVSQMDAEHAKIGLLAFADRCSMKIAPTDDYGRLDREIDKLYVGDVGYCNAAQPFTETRKTLSDGLFKKDKAEARYLVVLTDGVWDDPGEAIREAKKSHDSDIEVIALGFGGADRDFLKKIASMEDFASLTNLSDLSGSFSKIAQTIGDSVGGGLSIR